MLILLLLILLLLAFGGACFVAATGVVNEAKKHQAFTSLDRHLPLQGRWLSYAYAALLTFLGIVFVLCAAYLGKYLIPGL
jgi:hypothetical protein